MGKGSVDEILRGLFVGLGIRVFGYASVSSWGTDPIVSRRVALASRPSSIMKAARSVIVIGIPISPVTIDTAPSIAYAEAYRTVNLMLDQATQRITMELLAHGYDAMPVPRDGYQGLEGLRESPTAFFSHRHAAYLAGLGTFGENNLLLNPEYGPYIRYSSVITSAPLPAGCPMNAEVCIHCGNCSISCPAGALTRGTYPDNITDKTKCIDRSAELRSRGISPCGQCISSCPIGRGHGRHSQRPESLELIRSYQKRR